MKPTTLTARFPWIAWGLLVLATPPIWQTANHQSQRVSDRDGAARPDPAMSTSAGRVGSNRPAQTIAEGASPGSAETISPQVPPAAFAVARSVAEAHAWAVPYGKEFWREGRIGPAARARAVIPSAGPSNVDLGEIIERVSHAFQRETESAKPTVDAKTYAAALDGRGLRFLPRDPEIETDPRAEASFRTKAVRSGRREVYRSGDVSVPWAVAGNTAQGLLSRDVGLIEHFHAGGEGIEWSWIVGQPPADGDAIEIEAEILGLRYAGASGRGHHFADANGKARVCVGNVTLVDSGGARMELPCDVSGNTLRVRVSAALAASAQYPIAIDPLISPEFGMDEPVVSFSLATSEDPAIASNGDEYLVVWSDSRNSGSLSVYGTRLTGAGAVLDPNGILLSGILGGGLYPAVASDGRDYLVAWRAGFTGGTVVGTRVSREGEPLDSNALLQIGHSTAHPRPAIASDGAIYLVVWEHPLDSPNGDEDILGARVSRDGFVLDAPSLTIRKAPGRQRGPAIAYNGSVFLVAWNDETEDTNNEQTHAARVNAAGAVLDPNGFFVGPGAAGTFPTPAVASNGRDFLVVLDGVASRVSGDGSWMGSSSLEGGGIPSVAFNGRDYLVAQLQASSIRSVLVSGEGAVLASASLTTGPKDLFSWSRPSVASVAGAFFVVWDERDLGNKRIWGAGVTGAGEVSVREVPISTAVNTQLAPAAACNGTDYLVVWEDLRLGTLHDIFGVRVSATGEVLDLAALPIRRGAGLEEAPAVASNGRDYFVAWQEFRAGGNDRWKLLGGRVTGEGALLDPGGVVISDTSGNAVVPAVASNDRDYLVAWTDWSRPVATGWDIFAARVTENAVVLDANGFAVATTPRDEYAPAVASDGRDYLVAWADFYPGLVTATPVTSAGMVTIPNGTLLTTTAHELSYPFPSVAFNGQHYLAVWHESTAGNVADIRGTRLSIDGTPIDDPRLEICSAPDRQAYPTVASDGTHFFVAWSDQRNGRGEFFGARVTADGAIPDGDGFFITESGSRDDVTVALAGNGRNFLAAYNVIEEGSLFRVRARTIEFTLPPPWLDADVGPVNLAGSATLSNGAFTVSGAGTNIWGRADAFHFAYQSLSGDGQIIARVASLDHTHPRAKAGVMLRDGLSAGARHALIGVTPEHGSLFQARLRTDGNSFQIGRGGNAPLWVRLVRRGNLLLGFQSTDGVRWRFVSFAWMNLPDTILAGLAVTSQNEVELNTAVFDHVSVTRRTSPTGDPPVPIDPLAAEMTVLAPSQTGEGITLLVSGIEGRYVIESSDDLSHWTSLGIVTNTDGAVEFMDHDMARRDRRFYRVRLESP